MTGHPIPEEEVARRPGDPARLIASSSKIKAELGWKPYFEDPERIITTAWNWQSFQKKVGNLKNIKSFDKHYSI